MTPEDVQRIREKMGLTTHQLAAKLRLATNGDRTIRRWENGDVPISGPASLALEYLEKEHVGSAKDA